MEILALVGVVAVVSMLVMPWIAQSSARKAQTDVARMQKELRAQSQQLTEALAQLAQLRQQIGEAQTPRETAQNATPKTGAVEPPPIVASPPQKPVADINTGLIERIASEAFREEAAPDDVKVATASSSGGKFDVAQEMERVRAALSAQQPENSENSSEHLTVTQPLTPPPATAAMRRAEIPARNSPPPVHPRQAVATRPPSDFELQMAKLLKAGKEWLFGGNLVFKVGLLILFIGVAFLVRLAANYVTVPVEFRLAGVAAGAIALLVWSWRIRESRRGIALPAQGAALATLMLVTFGAFKLFHVIPRGATFAMLFVLVAFTCLLAVLQDAIWLAIFGIAGGFAAPILTSTGGGSHIALFSYYALLNAGVLAIALKRSWRALNLLGFAFTFIVGAAWGEQRYVADNYLSSQLFLILFWLFYIVIAVLFAWRRAPQLKSYVDGTLVFGVPMAGMALQYGLVKDIHFGMSISALSVALTYAITATVLWRWRRGNLRLLVESFLALAVVFGTLAIPLAFDGRWTSAAWAVEGAAIVWMGLRQKQKLAWQFGVAVQLGSWVSFLSAFTGLNPLRAFHGNVGLGFLLLGVTGVLMALMFRRHTQTELDAEQRSRQRFGWMASGFICVAVLWLLLGLWAEVWLRIAAVHRPTLLVLTALALVFGLQFLGRKSAWHLPEMLGGAVAGVAGITFATLMYRNMDWHNFSVYSEQSFGELLVKGPLLGALMLCAGALVSAFAFKQRIATMAPDAVARASQTASTWLLVSVFWWCGFALHGIAHAASYLTTTHDENSATPWYAISFWAAYGIGLSASALAWMQLAVRKQFPNARWMLLVFWPALTALGALMYWKQTAQQLGWTQNHWNVVTQESAFEAFLNLLAGPLLGALILTGLAWHGVFRIARGALPIAAKQSDAAIAQDRSFGTVIWLTALGLAWYCLVIDALAVFAANSQWLWQLRYTDIALLLVVISGMVFLQLAKRKQLLALRWLATPAAALQALASAIALKTMYLEGTLPSISTGIAMLGCWLGMAWCLRYWQRNEWKTTIFNLRLLHFGRVIAPWIAIAPIVSLSSAKWLSGETPESIRTLEDSGWIVAGMWPDYLAAWISIVSLFVLLRQVKSAGWPLRPLQSWYGQWLIPLATLWGVLLAIYWNLRQDGNMSPLPYLPLLNPLDITTGFVALLVALVWRANKSSVVPELRATGIKIAMALSFGWLNLMLLRTASHYLNLPYRFSALYASQFIQAMMSIVWTLTAFLLMRYAARKLSKPLWMVGAALLVVVVIKLALVDLSNSGSIARIVSFMGVGGLMLVIGYLAPLPRTETASDVKETT